MTYIAIIVLGFVSIAKLPVSLMPDIDIPEINIQLSYENSSARELENSIVKPLRTQLLQVSHLKDIKSETRNGQAVIRLIFDFGTNINLAYIETNEKIDATINMLPRNMERPKVVKANSSDIPVFQMNISLKADSADIKQMLELSEFCSSVIQKRIEQFPEVAMVDITGLLSPQVNIVTDSKLLKNLNISNKDIEYAIISNNYEIGNFLINDGQYQYNISFSNTLKDIEDIKKIRIKVNNSVFRLDEIADISIHAQKQLGMFSSNGKQAINMRIIKQSNAKINDLKYVIDKLIHEFSSSYKELDFEIANDQTKLLTYSIENLKQSLMYGGLLAFLLMFLFLKNIKSPFLIGISIPTSLIVSMLFFFIFNISINIISLSGLILGVGMMIDNSIIVIDNINQHYQKNNNIANSCINGTNEVIRPLLSSVLTTSAVFLPLIFLSGISGALFYDQAVAISTSLFASFVISITLLPTAYNILHRHIKFTKLDSYISKINILKYDNSYQKGFNLVFKHKAVFISIIILLTFSSVILFKYIPKQKLPTISRNDIVLNIDWNENITIFENNKRLNNLLNNHKKHINQYYCLIGNQQYYLNRNINLNQSESEVYIKFYDKSKIIYFKKEIHKYLKLKYPDSKITFSNSENIFDQIFNTNETYLELRVRNMQNAITPDYKDIKALISNINSENELVGNLQLNEYIYINIEHEKLLIYDVDYQMLYSKLKSLFNQNKISTLKSFQKYIPIYIGFDESNIYNILNNSLIKNKKNVYIPLNSLISTTTKNSYKTITSGKDGEYLPLVVNIAEKNIEYYQQYINKKFEMFKNLNYKLSGYSFDNKNIFNELIWVLVISILLLYFILAAQFESLIQPFIVLLEIPIDISGVFIMLFIFGSSLNLMSGIGIVVMSGIIINDSILKIDTINKIRNTNVSLIEAIKQAGHRRLESILMTSITTILALLPFLFQSGMGVELQLPLALSVIGGMLIGTIVSLYFIPLAYWFIYRKSS